MMNSPVSQAFSELAAFGLWMQKQGYRYSTVLNCIKSLRAIARRTNLLNPEQVKTYLATSPVSENRKDKLTQDLARFYKYKGVPFEKPNYRRVEKLPFIPTETEVDQLISGLGPKAACFLQLLKETGMRAGEAWNLKWTDLNTERRTLTVTPEKNSKPRQLKLSTKLIAMLNQLPRRSDQIFGGGNYNDFARWYYMRRRLLAEKLGNSRLRRISFKTFRHWKATTEYHRTRDILHVMQLLGHKNIRNTLVYTHLIGFESDEFVCKVAHNVREATHLIEQGFDYVTELDSVKLFRKRK
jgi:integrase